MKTYINLLAAGMLSLCACMSLSAQEAKEHISKQFNVNPNSTNAVLAIYNIFGSIKVEGYNGDKVLLEIDKNITSKYPEEVTKGKQEFRFEMEQQGDSIIVYIAAPHDSRPNQQWSRNEDSKSIRYKYQLDFVVKVPHQMRLRVSTINEGNVYVKEVHGALFVSNVNGKIDVEHAKGVTKATTVNGDVTVSYLTNPPAASNYKTINGDITVKYQNGLNADLYFKSMNGKYFTDFENVEPISNTLEKNTETKSNSTLYKISKGNAVRIGTGGNRFNFETLNGNVYIKKS
ncbi:hypothetical protein KACHI17_14790 [Sediminibacterium sp. KACHI17]|jgi:hypothetical protein|uniref:Adhesin domain-containing protein n=1 Tax=Sediminibacterium sp. KACHI17 TaxID=1751071 RepID=A0AAT9GJ06_9BACT